MALILITILSLTTAWAAKCKELTPHYLMSPLLSPLSSPGVQSNNILGDGRCCSVLSALGVQCLASPGLCLITAVASQPRTQSEQRTLSPAQPYLISDNRIEPGAGRRGVEITIGTLSGIGE